MKVAKIVASILLAASMLSFTACAAGEDSTPSGGSSGTNQTDSTQSGNQSGNQSGSQSGNDSGSGNSGGDSGSGDSGSGNQGGGSQGGTTPTADPITVNSYGGYEEGAYIEFTELSGVTNYTVSYKKNGGSYTALSGDDAKNLIREIDGDNGVWRADILGLAKGEYTLKVEGGSKAVEKSVTVTAYDRSGYAHFHTDGVGAYKDDGTLKSDAKVVYVTDATKNSVTIPGVSSSSAKGIVGVLGYSQKLGKPLVVRIIGSINAATWNEINYDKGGDSKFNNGTDYNQSNKLPENKVIGRNDKQLPTDSKQLTQAALIEGKYNTLNTEEYTELEGLESKVNYSGGEYDSCWNNCNIKNAEEVTVEGVGTDARIFQWGFTWKSCNAIEVRNLTFEDYTEDACSFEGGSDQTDASKFDSKNIWVHHNTFLEGKNYWDVCPEQDKHEGDGATDFKKNSYITIAYNHYYMNHKTGLIGGGDTQKTACVTFHHNWYEDCDSRLPLARQANMHMYNNYYDGSTGTNMSIRAGGYAFIEYCYFNNANNPITTQYDKSGVPDGVAKVYECVFIGKSVGAEYKDKTVYIVTDRTKAVTNYNVYNKTFDTDSSYFYYDSSAKKTQLASGFEMLTAEQVKVQVPKIAGVHTNKA